MSVSKCLGHKRGTVDVAPVAVTPQRRAPALYSAQAVLGGQRFPELSAREADLFSTTAAWLDASISRPHRDLGRAGDVCPWTRRTLQLGRLFLSAIPNVEPGRVDAGVLELMSAFTALDSMDGFGTFRAIVAVFPAIPAVEQAGASFVVAVHRRLKPVFLKQRLMLGEFYPGCPKPGLHNPEFRPLHAPHPLLVIRAMVEADLWFLTDRDAFVDAYLDAFGERGRNNLCQLLRADALDEDARRRLERRLAR